MKFELDTYSEKEFQNISLPKQDLNNKEFSNCTFKKCDFNGCKFSGSVFIDCSFQDCNLSNIKVDICSFQNVLFKNCKLLGVIFATINAFLIDWKFNACRIELCDFGGLDMRNSKFFECAIRETDFINSNLAGSDFGNSDLRSSKFQNTNLEKVNFVGAKNYYIDPTQNKLKKAKFSQPEVLFLLAGFDIEIE